MRCVVRPRVLEAEPLGQIEIELHRRALPLPSDGVDQLEVEFRAVERTATDIIGELLSTAVEYFGQGILRLLPPLRTTECFVGTRRQLDGVRVAEGLEHLVTEIEEPLGL